MYNVTVIVPRGQGLGFALAGVRVRDAADNSDANKILSEEMADDRNGIILIDEAFLVDLPPLLRKRVDETTVPLVVGIPIISKWEYISGSDKVIGNIIRNAIGYRIKLKDQLN